MFRPANILTSLNNMGENLMHLDTLLGKEKSLPSIVILALDHIQFFL